MPDTKLSDFLSRLADDPDLQDRYVKNTKHVLEKESGLSQKHQDVLLAGDLAPIRDAVKAEVGGDTLVFGVIKGTIK